MAIDLANHVPPEYPASVESFLREAVGAVVGKDADQNAPALFVRLVAALSTLENVALKQTIGKQHLPIGRSLIFQTVTKNCIKGTATEYRPFDELGLPAEMALPLSEFAIWLFREIQAMKALAQAEVLESEGVNTVAE